MGWAHPDVGKSAKDTAYERATQLVGNQKPPITLSIQDMFFIKSCNAVPLSNRDSKLNYKIRGDMKKPGADTMTCKFEIEGVTVSYEVYLPPLETMAAGFGLHTCDMDLSHVQTYLYRLFYLLTEQKPTRHDIGQMNQVRFRALEPAGNTRKPHANLLLELQRAEMTLFLCTKYVVEPVVVPVEVAVEDPAPASRITQFLSALSKEDLEQLKAAF
jgi:hypothetical protein